ncbi:MAG: hypothetical protein V1837_05155 [Candidatus Woesearchaeota archaeon]
MQTWKSIIAVFLIAAAFFAGMYLEGTLTGKAVMKLNKTSVERPDMDVPNVKEGTIVLWTNENYNSRTEGLIEFFSSKKIPGLWIRYNFAEKKLLAGLPPMKSEVQVEFDGNTHYITYVYNKEQAGQALFFDDQLVAQGEYTGSTEGLPVGMVTGYPAEQAKVHIEFFSKQLTKEGLLAASQNSFK